MRSAVELVDDGTHMRLPANFDIAQQPLNGFLAHRVALEDVQAFIDKRVPNWVAGQA
jgi:hypothetical protein